MAKKNRSTLYLFLAVLLTGAVIVVQNVRRVYEQRRYIQHLRLFDLDPSAVVSITFQGTNLTVECRKENGVWFTGSPEKGLGRADEALVYRMFNGLNSIGKGIVITGEQLRDRGLAPGQYGFSPPSWRITVIDNHGRRTWLIGRHNTIGKMLYAKLDGSPDIYTIPDLLLRFLPSDTDQFRDRSLFPCNLPAVRRLEIRGPSGLVQLFKDPRLGWQIQQPFSGSADPETVEDFLKRLYCLRIERFIAENVSDFAAYGLQDSPRRIAVGGMDGSSRMLIVGDEVPEHPGLLYARHADASSVFAVRTNILAFIDVKADDFRDVRLVPIAENDISYVSISRGDETLELERASNGVWSVTRPVSWKADPKAVKKLLDLWTAAVIIEFRPGRTNRTPEWVLRFGSAEAGVTNTIRILPTGGRRDGLRLTRDDDPALYQINLPVVPDTIIDPLQYKDPTIWKLRKSDIHSVRVEHGEVSWTVRRDPDGSFRLSGAPSAARLDGERLDRLLGTLSTLTAKSYVTYNPRDLSVYGFDEPTLVLHLGLSASDRIGQVLLVGKETPDGFYAMVKGRDVVFLLDKKTVAALSEPPFDEETRPADAGEADGNPSAP